VHKLLREGVLRLEWFTPHVHEVQQGPVRLVFRRSEAVRRKAQRRRADKLAKLHALITARNACVRTAKRAQPEAGLRALHAWITPTQAGRMGAVVVAGEGHHRDGG
jgi:hypothetical protein